MPKWTDYTIKTDPADKDEVMILDTAGKANKRLGLSVFSDWIIGKIANKVFENLQTQNKTILGAINELHSNFPALKSIKIDGMNASNQTLHILKIGRLVQLSARFVAEKSFEPESIIASDLPLPILDKDRVIKAYNSSGVETATFNIASEKLILKTSLAPTTDVRFDASYIC